MPQSLILFLIDEMAKEKTLQKEKGFFVLIYPRRMKVKTIITTPIIAQKILNVFLNILNPLFGFQYVLINVLFDLRNFL